MNRLDPLDATISTTAELISPAMIPISMEQVNAMTDVQPDRTIETISPASPVRRRQNTRTWSNRFRGASKQGQRRHPKFYMKSRNTYPPDFEDVLNRNRRHAARAVLPRLRAILQRHGTRCPGAGPNGGVVTRASSRQINVSAESVIDVQGVETIRYEVRHRRQLCCSLEATAQNADLVLQGVGHWRTDSWRKRLFCAFVIEDLELRREAANPVSAPPPVQAAEARPDA